MRRLLDLFLVFNNKEIGELFWPHLRIYLGRFDQILLRETIELRLICV